MSPIDFTSSISEGVAWPWPIAVYLFFAGISGGSISIALLVRYYRKQVGNTPLLKAASLVSFGTICLGMLCLVLDLTNPLFFWKILLYYNLNSVMSLGVIVLLFYIPLTAVIAAYALEDEIKALVNKPWVAPIYEMAAKFRGPLETLMLILAVCVCAYTGFLISALMHMPVLNTSILPALFIISGLSAGAATAKMIAVRWFNEPVHSVEMEMLHKVEWPIMAIEGLFLFMLFAGLILGDGSNQAASVAFYQGGWSALFWTGVIGLGFIMPLILNFALGQRFAHSSRAFYLTGGSVVCGMMCLRLFLLYSGQIYAV